MTICYMYMVFKPVEVTVMTRSRGSWEEEGRRGRRGSWRRRRRRRGVGGTARRVQGGREGESDLSQPCQFNQNHLKTSVSSVNL